MTLPNRRDGDVFDFTHENITYRGMVGYDPEGKPIETFLSGGKPGSPLEAACRDVGIAISKALQAGVTLHEMRSSLTRLDDENAAGPAGALLDKLSRT